jgi:hypothetical protein
LPFHDGHGGDGTDVAEAEDAGAVRAHGDRAPDHRVPAGERRVLGDRRAHARHARRVDVAHVLDVADGAHGVDLQLAALVLEQSAVLVPEDLHLVELVERRGDPVGLSPVAHLDGDRTDRPRATERDGHDVADDAVLARDRARDPRELPGAVGVLEVVCAVERHGRTLYGARRHGTLPAA